MKIWGWKIIKKIKNPFNFIYQNSYKIQLSLFYVCECEQAKFGAAEKIYFDNILHKAMKNSILL